MKKNIVLKVSIILTSCITIISLFLGKYIPISAMQVMYESFPIPWITFPFEKTVHTNTIWDALRLHNVRFPSINILYIAISFLIIYGLCFLIYKIIQFFKK